MKYKLPHQNSEVDSIIDEYLSMNSGEKKDVDVEKKRNEPLLKIIQDIEIDKLKKNPNNHFHQIEGDKWDDFVGSVKEYGIVTPLLVRLVENDVYEILAGHNRLRAAIEIGLKTVPCRVIECDDIDASVLVGITNNQRESTTDREWGWAYRHTYEVISKQGKRTDLTSSHAETKLRSDEIIAEKYGISRATVQRKMRLTYLVEPLYQLYANKKISQQIVIELSYLNDVNQANVVQAICCENGIVTEEIAKKLRKKAEAGEKMGIDDIYALCTAEKSEVKVRPRRYKVADELFPADLKKGDRDNYISAALRYIIEHDIKLGDYNDDMH